MSRNKKSIILQIFIIGVLTLSTKLGYSADIVGVADRNGNYMSNANPFQRHFNSDGFGNSYDSNFNNNGSFLNKDRNVIDLNTVRYVENVNGEMTPSCQSSYPVASCGTSQVNPTGNPVGGGAGYSKLIPQTSADFYVVNRDDLLSALTGACHGDIIYVADTAVIDLTGEEGLPLNQGVTLASGRGTLDGLNSRKGALLFTNSFPSSLFEVQGEHVRVTGIRIRGASSSPTRDQSNSFGIRSSYGDFEVDNCEIYNWTHAAIDAHSSAYIHHNNIHHNRKHGLGYGVEVDGPGADVLIEANLFNANRHAIAGTGHREQNYQARYNLSLWSSNGHVFDMHQECRMKPFTESIYAGNSIVIENNTFLNIEHNTIHVRGDPYTELVVRNNAFAGVQDYPVIVNCYTDSCYEDRKRRKYAVLVSRNKPDIARERCLIPSEIPIDPSKIKVSSNNCYDYRTWVASSGATDDWFLLAQSDIDISELAFGDFNGDRKTDVIRGTGKFWFVSWGGTSVWEQINVSSYDFSNLAIGDFNGDGKDDVFRANGSEWLVSFGATSDWVHLDNSSFLVSDLAFGDFDGNEVTDIFRGNGSDWYVSYGYKSSRTGWVHINKSSYPTSALSFGDFNGDRKTDVFLGTGKKWYISWSGTSGWDYIGESTYANSELIFGDFTGDNQTDILRISIWNNPEDSDGVFARFMISESGKDGWKEMGEAPPFSHNQIAVGNFNGDEMDDVFVSHSKSMSGGKEE